MFVCVRQRISLFDWSAWVKEVEWEGVIVEYYRKLRDKLRDKEVMGQFERRKTGGILCIFILQIKYTHTDKIQRKDVERLVSIGHVDALWH